MLIDLGIAALFHDIGKTDVPNEILNKPTDLIDSEWRIMRKHPTWGVKSLLKMRDIDELTIRSAFAAFEHHMNLDNSGYPRLKTPAEMDLFSKIVTIADRYDAMTSARVYTRTPLTAEKSLSILMELSGQRLDSLILKYFVNMMGIYPIGSLVKLDSNELGLVFENNQQSLSRPRVMLITDSKGSLIEGTVTDLTEMNDENKYARTITKIMDPKKYGINIAEYLL
jgi:HD-GYP domain-containing protein (c-di-GMP phosphodiesterase class II)